MRELPAVSRPLLHLFRSIVRGYFRRHFTAVRLRGADQLIVLPSTGPLIVYANHGGWWDPMISVLLAHVLFPDRQHFAPMDADALARYPILSKIGIFPVDMHTARGAAQFLRTGETVLRAGGVLWITPQGRFADPRERPLVFKPGIASLVNRVPEATVLPLAIEYPFWNERLPEALLEFGEPRSGLPADRDAAQDTLIQALTRTMDSLSSAVLQRSPLAFDRVLLRGRVGTGGFYALGQRVRSFVLRRPYRPEHTRTPDTQLPQTRIPETRIPDTQITDTQVQATPGKVTREQDIAIRQSPPRVSEQQRSALDQPLSTPSAISPQ